MAAATKSCPECGADLGLGRKSGLTIYPCPGEHGVGVNLLDTKGHFQQDELEAIWDACRDAPVSQLRSPITGRPMVEVTFVVDDDLMHGNEGRNAFEMTIEVDLEHRFAWFSVEELHAMPTHYETGAGLVGLDALKTSDRRTDAFFGNLTEDDYKSGEQWAAAGSGSSGIFSGLVRRLRS